MSFLSASAARTAVCVIALSGAGLWALHAMDAKADPPPIDDGSPCAEGRALFAAKLAYLEARERLQRMERHAAAMQAMFGAMAKAYVAIAPNLTTAQRDILSRNIVPSPPFRAPFPRRLADQAFRLTLEIWL